MSHTDDELGDSVDDRRDATADSGLGADSGTPSAADEIGEGAGGITGVFVGAGIGAAAGPVGALVGGIAGALSGWWAGRAVVEAAERITMSDDAYYRQHFESLTDRPVDRSFDSVRGAYYLGQIASHNPNFVEREFDDVEPELERGWGTLAERYGAWPAYRHYAREGFVYGRERRARERLSRQIEPGPPGERRV